jgi:hypothetical protein
MDRLGYQLDTIDGTPFKSIAVDFLRHEGYNVRESGRRGTGGGWDAWVEIADREGTAHASVRTDSDCCNCLPVRPPDSGLPARLHKA